MITLLLLTISNWVLAVIGKLGYAGIVLLSALESMNVPIPSEVILPFSGFLVAQGNFSFWVVVLAGAVGNVTGSLISYWFGYLVRNNGKVRESVRVQAELVRAHGWVDRYGDWAVLISRLLPVVRTFISFPLGIIKVDSLWRFSWLTFVGAFIWSYVLAKLGMLLGEHWESLGQYFRRFDYIIVVATAIAFMWWFRGHLKKRK